MFTGTGGDKCLKFGFIREEVCTFKSALFEPNWGYLLGTDFFLANAWRDFESSAASDCKFEGEVAIVRTLLESKYWPA